MLVFGHSGFPVILFPTLTGRYYEGKDSGLVNSISHLLHEGKIKLYCPDSSNHHSWYNYDIQASQRVSNHLAYEKMILYDVIAFAKHETGYENVGLAGCGFGGYHALNIALKYPDEVSYLFTLSGTFDIKRFIFGHYDDDCYYNNPMDYLHGLNDIRYLNQIKKMRIVLGAGEYDETINENEYVSKVLFTKNVNHRFDLRSNGIGHWAMWCEMFRDYLSQIS